MTHDRKAWVAVRRKSAVNTSLDSVSSLAQVVKDLEGRSDLDRARQALKQSLREARDAGFTLREIGSAAGLSHQRIAQILEQEEK